MRFASGIALAMSAAIVVSAGQTPTLSITAPQADGSRLVANIRTKDLGYSERAHVDAVLVPILVTDGGKFVRGLKKSEFELWEDGVPQQIVAFANEDSPLDLVLAIDVSGSMDAALGEVKTAVTQLLSR